MGQLIARAFLWLTGWKPAGPAPTATRYVLIAAPHTSNWDLAYLLALAAVLDVKVSWMGKHVLFRPPLGWILRPLGGIPVFRHERRSMVAQMIDAFARTEGLVLTVPAEGTRGRAPLWKSGFYHIAHGAGVPIVCGYLDYSKRRGGFGPAIVASGDIPADMARIRAFYADKVGRYPDRFGPILLREEVETAAAARA